MLFMFTVRWHFAYTGQMCLFSEQKRSQTLDIVTGFHVIDDNVHVIVLEGLREGAMQRIRDEVLPTDVGGKLDSSFAFYVAFITLRVTYRFTLFSVLHDS